MKVKCICCGHELNLDHRVFENYEGPAKCFSCGRMVEVKTMRGTVYSINPLAIFENRRNEGLIDARS